MCSSGNNAGNMKNETETNQQKGVSKSETEGVYSQLDVTGTHNK